MTRPGHHDVDWNVLDRYFSGEATPEETARISRVQAHAEGAEFLRSVRELWDAAGVMPTSTTPDVAAAWRSVSQRAADEHVGARDLHPTRAAVESRRRTRRIALPRHSVWPAMLVACAASAIAVIVGQRAVTSRAMATRAATPAPTMKEFTTRRAQRADVYLSDGTHVLLNVDSRLRVSSNYGARGMPRDVLLEGEAYFDVVHDRSRPFRVRTATGTAEDNGTVFVVSSYPEAKGMRVSVSSGAVIVRRDSVAPVAATLGPGDVGRMDAAGKMAVRHHAPSVDAELAWTTGKLVFDRTPLDDALPRLARWFDADIRLGDRALGHGRYTATIRHEPVGQVLELLAASLDARLEREGERQYVLYMGRRAP